MSYSQEDLLAATRNLKGETIPVHVEIKAEQVILSQPEMRELLAGAETIAVGMCACRDEEANCGNPRDVCLSLDAEARQKIADGGWRKIGFDEAMDILDETYRHGLVHMAYRRVAHEGGKLREGSICFVCSCCTCCCWPLNGLRQYDYHDGIAESEYVAHYDESACVACGTCMDRCPFGAFSIPEGAGSATFTESRCFGCGLCIETCPSTAIRLLRRIAGD